MTNGSAALKRYNVEVLKRQDTTMPKPECRITKECRSPNDRMSPHSLSAASVLVIRHLSLVRHSLVRASAFLLLIFLPALQAADNIGVLGSKPQWSVLKHYQETITRDNFARLIQSVYCTHGFAPDLIEIN